MSLYVGIYKDGVLIERLGSAVPETDAGHLACNIVCELFNRTTDEFYAAYDYEGRGDRNGE